MISEPISLVQCWCVEAVEKFGDDWPMLHEHVRQKLSALTEEDRIQIVRAVALILRHATKGQMHYQ
jgi:hypothetical protein